MANRFLVDYSNPDAGIGHSLAMINLSLKLALKNNLVFCYSEKQLMKSSNKSWEWRLSQIRRAISLRKPYETHNIGNDLNILFAFKDFFLSRDEIERRIKNKELRLIHLPHFQIKIPSNNQIDDEAYLEVNQFIQKNPQANVVFSIAPHEYGDSEYSLTREFFISTYNKARNVNPIPLNYKSDRLNVAVHIRRGDLLPGRQYADLDSRMLPDSWYLSILRTITLSTKKLVTFHIFSEGKNGQYYSEKGIPFSWKNALQHINCEVIEYIDSELIKTFHHLVNADILVGSKSGMTHISGMMGDQIKIVPQMWHSYRGAKKTLEISGLPEEALEIENFLKKYL